MVGIFWIHKGTVIGRAVKVEDGDESVPGIVDSSDNHTDFWDEDQQYLKMFPELQISEYFDVPRGRVMYSREACRAIVYMDKSLFNEQTKQVIRDFFSLKENETDWRTDSHYTTSSKDIDRLFE